MSFVHLHCHSYYSLLAASPSPERLARRAAALGMKALALTDTDAVYGSVEFYRACLDAGVKPILGAEITEGSRRAVFLARDRAGWSRICRLVSRRRLDDGFSLSRELNEIGEHVVAFTAFPGLLPGDSAPPSNLYLEITPALTSSRRDEILAAAARRRIPLLAAADVRFLDPAERGFLRLLRDGNDFSPFARLLSAAEMEAALGEWPAALTAPARVAEECEPSLELGVNRLPRVPLSPGETPEDRLRARCRRGLGRRFPSAPRPVLSRLSRELKTIFSLGLADYFLLVDEIVAFARSRSIPLLGRGSAANSLVCYLLGMTDVDPLKHRLYFERFLNPARADLPDIDLDFPTDRRDEVIDFVYRRFGSGRVAMLSTMTRFRARSALRHLTRRRGWKEEAIGELTRQLPYFASLRDPSRIEREVPECRHLPWRDGAFRNLLRAAARLEGFPGHLSVHPGGMVIAPAPLTDYLALERAPKGIVVTQPDMYSAKELGLLKIDILGQRALAVAAESAAELARRGIRIDWDRIDVFGDRAAGDLIASGRTLGCFYIESPVMRRLLRRLRCRDFSTLVAASSVIRPGVSNGGLTERYIARVLGREETGSFHPRVDRVLEETRGVMIYQEQVMRVLNAAAGFSLAEADHFRRCMTKKPGWEGLERYRSRFFAGAAARGLGPSPARELWRQLEGFAGYAFCKAHSASYAVLSFRMAYLKAHHPAVFLAAQISNGGGFYPGGEYVREAARMGIGVLAPDVNRSGRRYLEEEGGIRIGLMGIKGLRRETADRILDRRELRPFDCWEDFLARVSPRRDELSALLESGALDSLGESRPALRWKLAAGLGAGEVPLYPGYGSREIIPPFRPPAPPPPTEAPAADGTLPVPSRRHASFAGKTILCRGRLVTARLVRSRGNGKLMKFITLDDGDGLFEAVLFPRAYRRFGHLLRGPGPFRLRGRVKVEDGVPILDCRFLSLDVIKPASPALSGPSSSITI